MKGFHRADVKIRVGKRAAVRVCSRGELKVIVWAMLLAQGVLARRLTGRRALYLVDDLASEFDEGHRKRVCEHLLREGEQVMLTGVERDVLEAACDGGAEAVFEVRQGEVVQV